MPWIFGFLQKKSANCLIRFQPIFLWSITNGSLLRHTHFEWTISIPIRLTKTSLWKMILEDKDESCQGSHSSWSMPQLGTDFIAQTTPFVTFEKGDIWLERQQNTILFSIRSRRPNKKMFADLKISISRSSLLNSVKPGETRYMMVPPSVMFVGLDSPHEY